MRMIKFATVFAALGLATAAHAGSIASEPASSDDSASQLASLQAQIPVWQARARIAKLKAEVRKAENGEAAGDRGLSAAAQEKGGVPAPAMPQAPTPDHAGPAMHLESVSAFNGRFVALLDVNGSGLQVRQGDEVADGWIVARITDSSVKLVRGRQSRTLRL